MSYIWFSQQNKEVYCPQIQLNLILFAQIMNKYWHRFLGFLCVVLQLLELHGVNTMKILLQNYLKTNLRHIQDYLNLIKSLQYLETLKTFNDLLRLKIKLNKLHQPFSNLINSIKLYQTGFIIDKSSIQKKIVCQISSR